MKIGVVLGTHDPEIVWNAFRFGVKALTANHTVKVFLMNSGVEPEEIHDKKFNVEEPGNSVHPEKRGNTRMWHVSEIPPQRGDCRLSPAYVG
jgi:hypothetical protein